MTSLILTDEQQELRSALRRLFEQRSSEAAVRLAVSDSEGIDTGLWRTLTGELGVAGLTVPEELGGAACGPVELGVVFEEAGRALACVPLLSTVGLALPALLLSGDVRAQQELLPQVANGGLRATVALSEGSASWSPGAGTVEATAAPAGGWTLRGSTTHVLDGDTADLLVVPARTVDGLSLFLVEGSAPGVHREPLPTLDETRRQATVTLDPAPGALLGSPGAGADVLAEVLLHAGAYLAAEQVGGIGRALDMAVGYAKVREQYGRPIGSFQAIKHACAQMLLELEAARSATAVALLALATGAADRAAAVHVAQAYCSEACTRATGTNIQVHGGIGFTWEHPAHLWFKRARTSHELFGSPTHHRDLLGRGIGI